jgi:hypothetical protein
MTRSKFFPGICLVAVLSLAALYVAPRTDAPPQTLPERFSDAEFWNLVTDFSEPGGYFRSDNFVSNESTFQHVIPELKKRTKPGGVYLGVGPDQNFTYIVALQPKVAFITDIRRNNMLLHLMYKALFELSDNRAEFLSRLFARPMPEDLGKDVTTEQLFKLFSAADKNSELATHTLEEVLGHLRDRHNFLLSFEDARNIEYIYNAFCEGGPQIRYSYPNQYGSRRFPSYAELMLEADEEGESHGYMASEENFQFLKKVQTENRILPIVGDFAGETALRSVGRFLKKHGAPVTAFYTSNVEFYLFQSDDWRKFLTNVSEMPMNDDSFFIRAYFNNFGNRYPNQPFGLSRSVTLLDTMPGLVAAFEAKQIRGYYDVVQRSLR